MFNTCLLRNNEISQLTPLVSLNKSLRNIIDKCQKDFCSSHNVVMEGRDLGSFVFPNAEIKFYLDCSIKERARRRFLEEQQKNNTVSLSEIEEQIAKRDHIDKTKPIAPLVVPNNAIIIDSSTLTIEEVLNVMFDFVQTKLTKHN